MAEHLHKYAPQHREYQQHHSLKQKAGDNNYPSFNTFSICVFISVLQSIRFESINKAYQNIESFKGLILSLKLLLPDG